MFSTNLKYFSKQIICTAFPNIIKIFIYFNTDPTSPISCEKKLKFIEGNKIKERGYLKDSL